jgi:hypothetical protein
VRRTRYYSWRQAVRTVRVAIPAAVEAPFAFRNRATSRDRKEEPHAQHHQDCHDTDSHKPRRVKRQRALLRLPFPGLFLLLLVLPLFLVVLVMLLFLVVHWESLAESLERSAGFRRRSYGERVIQNPSATLDSTRTLPNSPRVSQFSVWIREPMPACSPPSGQLRIKFVLDPGTRSPVSSLISSNAYISGRVSPQRLAADWFVPPEAKSLSRRRFVVQ